MSEQTRRDFLFLLTGLTGAVGIGAVAWPLIRQICPDESVLASSSVEVDISGIEEGMSVTVQWRGQPVVIRNRTAKEIAEARTVELSLLKDPQARNPNLEGEKEATDFARSAGEGRENWLILINLCTHLGCVTLGQSGRFGGWLCPCHGSVYDTAGRVRSGPANYNLAIPPYQFLSDTLLKIG
ncbi:ubiquinol-cytochrome c reductase iron-sulfur subunit [Bartonella doshiae]|uniref:Ubiquinol-cytochrome c reductase iron-sulfur subunit n=2 Tax=Bartonella doshiae TaxID=33044 RepID=A0A380ZG47_BARDO|nr:ubiquinol-cytochrome c reductase iron-sulfur subunit [Bartonella doshiae]EJF81114.1 ubiquinol-cytochrome c reductase, iron-sulfur subunit [Bartonella doshiae NCTC 12862 = ATCC 700133]MBB6159176.1 ubiquinol-cytochrome c reductase iron-sulfur subunit [Bartonella doshiae]SUV45262.1 Ubiquinol-cytochrome c reductase iron-sulfur subunit [Bartonella doshiae]